jgi:hypothetical protein
MQIRFRPIQAWPGALTVGRTQAPFRATFSDTLKLLEAELGMIGAHDVVSELALAEGDIRIDGWPRATAKPSHPGVILSFDSNYGDLRYFTDLFGDTQAWRKRSDGGAGYSDVPGWHMNLRAIALGLEALRKVDRYGISRRGEQYTGWRALTQGSETPLTVDGALLFLASNSGLAPLDVKTDPGRAYRVAARRLHPDAGGTEAAFARLQKAKALLDGEGR